jgi:hypothetical protein
LEGDLEKERAKIREGLTTNIWLSHKDKEDLQNRYDEKLRSMYEMKSLLAKTREGIFSEDTVIH